MKVLITGNEGFIGKNVENTLIQNEIDIIGYDVKYGNDICNYEKLKKSALGCDVIIHLAAVDNEIPNEIMDINIVGTINVLNIFRETSCKKLIFMSSVDSLGIFQGESKPKYLPIDDKYPCHPQKAYSLSKYSNEKMCEYYYSVCKKPILCIRAPGVWNEETYLKIQKNRKNQPSYEWSPYWEYGAFIDVRDLAEAIYKATIQNFNGYQCVIIASDDITTSGKTSRELVDFIFPEIEWRGNDTYIFNPYKTLIDNSRIKELLNWSPKHSWSKHIEDV